MQSGDSDRSRFERLTAEIERLPLAPSVLGGLGSFVGGYALFVALVTVSGNVNYSNPVAVLKQLGSLFYNAHNVPLLRYREITVGGEPVSQQAMINLLQQADPSLPRPVYYAVPVVAIAIGAAVLVARYVDTGEPVKTTASVVGGMALGYVLAALVGSFLVAQRTTLESAFETLSPAPVETLAFGVAYPVLVTLLIGGAFVGWTRWRSADGLPSTQA